MKTAMIAAVNFYSRWISPAFPGSCRFLPTCSRYAAQALESHGALKGTFLTLGRLARCHPFNPGGYDPVPGFRKETGKRRNGETEIQTAV